MIYTTVYDSGIGMKQITLVRFYAVSIVPLYTVKYNHSNKPEDAESNIALKNSATGRQQPRYPQNFFHLHVYMYRMHGISVHLRQCLAQTLVAGEGSM